MWSSLIEIDDRGFEKPGKLLLMQDEEVIQTFSPHAPQKTFTDGISAARVRYGVRSTLMLLVAATRARIRPEFAIIIPNQVFGCLPIRRRFAQLVRHPKIGRRARYIHMDDLSRRPVRR